jgi:hypothetical protein
LRPTEAAGCSWNAGPLTPRACSSPHLPDVELLACPSPTTTGCGGNRQDSGRGNSLRNQNQNQINQAPEYSWNMYPQRVKTVTELARHSSHQIYSLEQYTVIPIATYSFVPPGCRRGRSAAAFPQPRLSGQLAPTSAWAVWPRLLSPVCLLVATSLSIYLSKMKPKKKQAYIVQYVIEHGGSALRFAQPALRGATQ